MKENHKLRNNKWGFAALLCSWEGWDSFMAQRLGILAGAFNGSSDSLSNTVQTLLLSAHPFSTVHYQYTVFHGKELNSR
jgi:hypothetical protein